MAPKSIPYWNGLMETRVHARRHFQFSSKPDVAGAMLMIVVMIRRRAICLVMIQPKNLFQLMMMTS